jgi:quinol monooxygenase YgiN
VILITGSILARAETFEEIKRLALAHVRRSRTEDGCLHHSVHVDVENPLRLVFVERWRDRAAVMKHFADKEARNFVKAARSLAAEPTQMALYDSEEIAVDALGN